MVQAISVDTEAAEKLAALERAAFPDRHVRATAEDMLAFSRQRGAAAFADVAIEKGYLLQRCIADEAEVLDLGVSPLARRQGVARTLLEAAERHAFGLGVTTVFLDVADDNAPARALYATLGFNEVARRQGYYARPDGARVDALIMRKSLVCSGA